jgi:hypothetical protein
LDKNRFIIAPLENPLHEQVAYECDGHAEDGAGGGKPQGESHQVKAIHFHASIFAPL